MNILILVGILFYISGIFITAYFLRKCGDFSESTIFITFISIFWFFVVAIAAIFGLFLLIFNGIHHILDKLIYKKG